MTEDPAPASVPKTHRPLTVVALMLAIFMAAMEVTVVSTAMPTVVGDLGGVGLYAWVFAAYVLSSTVGVPIFGKLADLYGRKPILIGGIIVFLIGSVACGLSRTMTALIVFRTLQGFGGGAMQSMSLTIVGDLFTLHERARMQGVMGAVWGLAGIVGPLVGGLIVDRLSWHWVFFVNVPFGLGSMAMIATFMRERVSAQRRPLDIAGALLLGAMITALLLGMRGGRALWGVGAALALAVIFIWVERRASDPILPFDLLSGRVILVASIVGTLIGGSLMSTLTYLPLFVQGVLGGTPTQAGAAIAPMTLGWPLASAIGGRLLPRLGFRPLVRIGLSVHALAVVGMAILLVSGAGVAVPRVSSALFGVGLGFANTALLIAVQTSVGWERRGVATASTLLFRSIGGALAVGMLGELLRSVVASDRRIAGEVSRLLAGGSGAALSPERAAELSGALAAGLHPVFVVIAGFGVVALLVGLAFPRLVVEPEVRSAR